MNHKMVKELWCRAYILEGGSIFSQEGKNWFLGGKKNLTLFMCKVQIYIQYINVHSMFGLLKFIGVIRKKMS